MPTFFRPPTRVSLFRRRRRSLPPGKLNPSDLAPSGTSSALFVGQAITPAVFASAGVGAFGPIGTWVVPAVLASAGVGSVAAVGTAITPAAFAMAGTSDFVSVKLIDLVTSRVILQDPVDCVLAGQQKEFKPGRAPLAALRGIFNE